MAKENKWIFFVLNFDDTYDTENPDELGVPPSVYLVPKKKIKKVEKCAHIAHDKFHADDEGCMGIENYFENSLNKNNIPYQTIGEVKLTFDERCCDWLSDKIHMALV